MSEHSTRPEFNPSGKPEVTEIKQRTESLLQYIRANVPDTRDRMRALDHYADGAMLAVKAATAE